MKKILFLIALIMVLAVFATANRNYMPHVYINPGHGGHTSDDRNVVIYPFAAGDTSGYWESNSNLKKGFALNNCLRAKGYTTSLSRVKNDQSDDLPLSTIVALCNSSGADIFYSIHSNATGVPARRNHILALYRGPTGSPVVANSDVLALNLVQRLQVNQAAVWTSNYQIAGDFTFYPDWNNAGLGVLRGNNAVSMLSEGSFHDYIPETYRLMNDNYCWMEGWNFSLGADDYFGYSFFDKGCVAGNIRDNRMPRVINDFIMFGDDNREPVCNATVILLDMDDNPLDTCYTDDLYNGIYAFKMLDPGNYKIRVEQEHYFSQTKQVTIQANHSSYCNFDLARVRETPPEVINYSPVWNEGDAPLKANTPVVFEFNWDMNTQVTENAFHIEPAVEGHFRWEDSNYRMVFEPNDAYDINTLYTVTLDTTAEHGGGMKLQEPFTLQFKTTYRKYLEVIDIFPHEGDPVHYKAATIELRTDSMLNNSYYYDKILLTDKDGNLLTYNRRSTKTGKNTDPFGFIRIPVASTMVPGEEYTLTILSEMSDTAGIHLPETIVHKFTAVDAGEEKPDATLIEGFEDASTFLMVTATSNGAENTQLSNSTDKLFGSKSLQIKYPCSPQGGQYEFTSAAISEATIAGDEELSLHIFGDMSTVDINIQLSSTDNSDHQIIDFGKIDFHGWRYITGRGNLKRDKTYKIESIFIGNNPEAPIKISSATIKLDNLLKSQKSGLYGDVNGDGVITAADITELYNFLLNNDSSHIVNGDLNGDGEITAADITAVYSILLGNDSASPAIQPVPETTTKSSVKVGPVPSSDYIIASASGYIQGVELYDMNGNLVARNGGNYMNAGSMRDGHYILKVYTATEVSSHHVAVKH
ncbi:MAG: N-acetylmuramoyl-L-alanine amidase [Muribaculaceae bacterium]|nr:N-acetylmuramoyl-L-alanine amidase [Muribaculaceae bacterium]